MIKDFIYQIKNLYKFYLIPNKEKEVIFFSEGQNYFNTFINYIKIIEKYKRVIYITTDSNDPIYKRNFTNLKIIYCKNIFLLILLMNNISCKNLIMTMPDLNNYEIKKSKNVANYIYLFHSLVSTHMVYKSNAFDSYDKILCITQNQYDELMLNKKLKNLNYELYKSNYPKLNVIGGQFETLKKDKIVTIAPSWGTDNIFENENFEILLSKLVSNGFKIILRPHSNVPLKTYSFLKILKKKYKEESIIIEDNNANFFDTFKSNYLITDWSGIAIEYFLITKKPVIFVDTKAKIRNKNFDENNDNIPLEVSIRNKIGLIIKPLELSNINFYLEEIDKKNYKNEIELIEKKILFSNQINENNFNQILN